jgi:hypothetical protein
MGTPGRRALIQGGVGSVLGAGKLCRIGRAEKSADRAAVEGLPRDEIGLAEIGGVEAAGFAVCPAPSGQMQLDSLLANR